jgi:undecaprenol kinase/diacylglycerol kinase (ATP)
MNNVSKRSFRYQLKTFRFALSGLRWFFTSEVKSRIHLLCAIAAVIIGIVLKISVLQWTIITLVIGLVFVVEILNTCIELIVDRVDKEFSEIAKRIKDLAAGAVFISAIAALVIGFMIFLPRISRLISEIR